MRQLALTLMALTLSGCLSPGVIAEHVDTREGELIRRILGETCTMSVWDGHTLSAHKYNLKFVSVVDVVDSHLDEGRFVKLLIEGEPHSFTYNPVTAMTSCGSVGPKFKGFIRYAHVSQILVGLGGDPTIYRERLARAQRRYQEAQRKARKFDATFPIRVKWDGMAGEMRGTIREVRVGSKGTMVIELPRSMGSTCTGTYSYTGHNVGTWNVTCPDDLTASGTFKSGAGAHGKGIDNVGRKVTYTIDVKN